MNWRPPIQKKRNGKELSELKCDKIQVRRRVADWHWSGEDTEMGKRQSRIEGGWHLHLHQCGRGAPEWSPNDFNNVSVAGLEPRCSSQVALVSNNSPGPQRSALDAAGKVFPVFGRLSISTSHQNQHLVSVKKTGQVWSCLENRPTRGWATSHVGAANHI